MPMLNLTVLFCSLLLFPGVQGFAPLQSSTGTSNIGNRVPIKSNAFDFQHNGKSISRRSINTELYSLDPSSIESSTAFVSTVSDVLSNAGITKAFSAATFGPQYLWILLVLFPNTKITKKVMGGYGGIIAFSLIHLFIVVVSASQPDGTAPMAEFSDVFDPSGDPQQAMVGMMRYPNFVTEEWSHVLTWDLFVGRFIWLDGIKRGIFTPHSVLLTNLIGPPGLLLHFATCLVTGKGIPGNEVPEEDDTI